jgi:hypothetical protein
VFIEQRDDDCNDLEIEGNEEETPDDDDVEGKLEELNSNDFGNDYATNGNGSGLSDGRINGNTNHCGGIKNTSARNPISVNSCAAPRERKWCKTILVEVPVKTYTEKSTGRTNRYFVFQCQRYIYDDTLGFFIVPENELLRKSCAQMHEPLTERNPVSEKQVIRQRNLRGENLIEVDVLPFLTMVTNECSTILYVWQYHALLSIAFYWYWHIAAVNIVLLVWSVLRQAVLLRTSQLEIQEMARKTTDVKVLRKDGECGK